MKKEREIYLKPLTRREQVVMEQGICSASIYEDKKINAKGHEVGNEYTFSVGFDASSNPIGKENGGGSISWE